MESDADDNEDFNYLKNYNIKGELSDFGNYGYEYTDEIRIKEDLLDELEEKKLINFQFKLEDPDEDKLPTKRYYNPKK